MELLPLTLLHGWAEVTATMCSMARAGVQLEVCRSQRGKCKQWQGQEGGEAETATVGADREAYAVGCGQQLQF